MGDSIVFAFKLAAAVAAAGLFLGAISVLVSVLVNFTFSSTGVFGDIIGLISVYLPFNPAYVFGMFLLSCNGILAFLIGRKVYQITNNIWGIA